MKIRATHAAMAAMLLACWQTIAAAQYGFDDAPGEPTYGFNSPESAQYSAGPRLGAIQPVDHRQPFDVAPQENTLQPGGYFEPSPPDVMLNAATQPAVQREVAQGEMIQHELTPPGTPLPVEAGGVLIEEPAGAAPPQQSALIFPTLRIFEPKARVYFDTGWESPSKLDIFQDGSLSPSINFIEILWQEEFPVLFDRYALGAPDWRWGPNIGIGLSSQASDSADGTRQASGAPVMLLSLGIQMDFPLTARDGHTRPQSIGVEFGYAVGFSADESLDYSADGAIYVGVSAHLFP